MENRSHRDLSCGQSFFLSSFMCATERCQVPWRLGDSPGPLTGERVETNAYTSSEGTKVYRNHHHNAIRAKQNRRNQTHRESARFTSSAQTQTNGDPWSETHAHTPGFRKPVSHRLLPGESRIQPRPNSTWSIAQHRTGYA